MFVVEGDLGVRGIDRQRGRLRLCSACFEPEQIGHSRFDSRVLADEDPAAARGDQHSGCAGRSSFGGCQERWRW